jgi:hypothetical protein
MPDRYPERDIPIDEEVVDVFEQPIEAEPVPQPQARFVQRPGYAFVDTGQRLPQFPIPRPRREPMEDLVKSVNAIQFQKANDAYKASLAVQAARAYYNDLRGGTPQAVALARWGHLLPGGLAGAARMTEASRPAFTPEPLPGNTNLYRVGPRGERLFQYRPQEPVMAPTVTNVGGVNVLRYGQGGRSATVVPKSALPQDQGEIIIKYDPTTKRHFQLRNNQWYPVTGEEAKRLTPLEKTATGIDVKAMKDAAETLREETRRGKPDSKRAVQATKDYQSASNALFQASQPVAETTAPTVVPPTPKTPKVKAQNQADAELLLKKANEAIAKGADRLAVKKWLESKGVSIKE